MNSPSKPFHFKVFSIEQDRCIMKVGTDGVLLGAWADVALAEKVLDIGSGTGLIALMIAQRNPHCKIHAVEIDAESALQSKENIATSPWPERIAVYHKSIQEFAKIRLDLYDHIVSNPPFFIKSTLGPDSSRNIARHTLDLPHTEILRSAEALLKKDGRLSVILPTREGREFIGEAISFGMYCNKIMEVYPREAKPVERLLMQFSRRPSATDIQQLLIHQGEDPTDYSAAYKALTAAFYKNF
jgi:tRNA1Val (adenine37-N6)-methyltransferase